VAQGEILPYFNEVFDLMCKVSPFELSYIVTQNITEDPIRV